MEQWVTGTDPEEPSTIGIDGTINYIQDLGVALEDPVVLALAYKLDAPTMGQFPKQRFIKGWQSMKWVSMSLCLGQES
jgi:DCN1-like protein 1/2